MSTRGKPQPEIGRPAAILLQYQRASEIELATATTSGYHEWKSMTDEARLSTRRCERCKGVTSAIPGVPKTDRGRPEKGSSDLKRESPPHRIEFRRSRACSY